MLINGEKYACEACVRGHRVSSCTHSDRKLLHVNKKGRPVSQCQHCRSLRKARSQHVKCDCQDKAHAKEDCPHLKEQAVAATAETNTCCCGHGARCTCALKKESPLQNIIEDFPQVIQPKEPHKSRISSLNSHENKTTIFVNGHHKPVHKINDAHNHCGAPYRKSSRSHTVHGHRDFAQRSTDSLPILKQGPRPTESPLHNVENAEQQSRKVKSEHNSPELGPINPQIQGAFQDLYIPPLSPTAYAFSPFESQSPAILPTGPQELGLPENIPDSWFTTFDEAHTNDMIPCAGPSDTTPVDWSTYNFCANAAVNANANGIYSMPTNGFLSNQPVPYTSPFEHLNFSSFPRLNSSSGDISETDDHSTINRPSNLRTVSNASNDNSSPRDDTSDNPRLSVASSYHGTPQANMLAGTLDDLDIDEFVAQTVREQKRMSLQGVQRQQQSISTPPSLQTQTQTPPLTQMTQTPPMQPMSGSPAMMQPQQTQPIQQPQSAPMRHVRQSPDQLQNDPNTSFSLPQSLFAPEHSFTVHEAQAFAHMNGNEAVPPPEPLMDSAMPTALGADPMWSAVADGASMFKLDDPREDEDWVR